MHLWALARDSTNVAHVTAPKQQNQTWGYAYPLRELYLEGLFTLGVSDPLRKPREMILHAISSFHVKPPPLHPLGSPWPSWCAQPTHAERARVSGENTWVLAATHCNASWGAASLLFHPPIPTSPPRDRSALVEQWGNRSPEGLGMFALCGHPEIGG